MANDDLVIPVHAIVDVAGTKVPVHEDGSLVISEVIQFDNGKPLASVWKALARFWDGW